MRDYNALRGYFRDKQLPIFKRLEETNIEVRVANMLYALRYDHRLSAMEIATRLGIPDIRLDYYVYRHDWYPGK